MAAICWPATHLIVRHFFAPRGQFDRSRINGSPAGRGDQSASRSATASADWRRAACWLAGARVDVRVTGRRPRPHRRRKRSIIVEGNRRVDAETVRSYFHAAPDGQFDDAARDAALKSLIATGLFDKVTIDRAGERLVVHVTEAPVLDRVAFEGNKKVKDTDLAAAVEVEAARLAAARCRAGRRRPHHRGLPARRPRRGQRRCRKSSTAAMAASISSM